ncbi:ABC transporter ATP-binding protein/permease [Arthrobacter sp. I2-34]|uniref:ABC transporter ATP-binding protein/permease n=1 Tax=Arthrobacter hankyongi TaxID=2904801 RepID=A0ABS9LCY6_9MICC|nr:ABC transporter ATP-binding protein [Arthrobacter hankyongi]MCG2624535.1 ABC transporter ATP-binding protein/permease [Arthrobacter hankyongi]
MNQADTGTPKLPRLLVGPRRKLMALLVATGLGMAVLSGASAFMMAHLLRAADARTRTVAVAGLLAAAGGIAAGRIAERVLAERLGQHYVQELRTGLMAAVLADGKGPSVGITIARITNDLTSVRNWITQGIAPLAVGIPVLVGTTAALWFLSPPLALAMALPLGFLGAILAVLTQPAFAKARALRKKRGRLAAQVSDTVAAAVMIRAAGGEHREVQQVGRLGGEVAEAAVARARVGGYIRAAAGASGTVTVVIVAATGSWLSIHTATTAAALTLVGLLAHHVNDLGRVAEFRQTYNAAKRMIAPALAPAAGLPADHDLSLPGDAVRTAITGPPESGGATVRISGLRLDADRPVPELAARPGDRIVLKTNEPGEATEVFEKLLALRPNPQLNIRVAGNDLRAAPGPERRLLAGYAARGAFTERGTIARAVRYRRPDLPRGGTGEILARVELATRVAQLPKGEHTTLRRGGEPLTVSDRARLQLARATLGDPPLLLLNHIDSDLGPEGCRMLAEVLRSYPGVAIIASDHPGRFVSAYTVWDLH